MTGPIEMQSRPPQRLIRVDIADTGNQRLIEQRPFYPGVSRTQFTQKPIVVKIRIQGITRDVGNGRGDVSTDAIGDSLVDEQSPEGALIDEPEFPLGPDIESNAQMPGICLTRADE